MAAYSTSDQGRPLATAQEWISFLEAELSDTRKAYSAKPSFLKGHRKAEQSIRQDYADRELLELVQNAADAAAEIGGGGRVRIVITPEGLLVANTGEPFRDTGVESLLTAHLSDKPQRKIALIGAKGLGFRSILNWSLEPIILSGALRLAFSESHAIACVRRMAEDDDRLSKRIGDSAAAFAPILPFPMIGAEVDQLVNPAAGLLVQAEGLRTSGYDTVVAAPFRDADSFSRAVAQASEFEPHFLLFVPALVQIDVEIEGHPLRRWIKTIDGEIVTLAIRTGEQHRVERWICRAEAGDAPSGQDSEGNHRFEVAVALRTDLANSVGRLHCFFPTSVILPLPALFHGTFELASNRKQLRDGSAANAFVLRRLARLYAETLADLLLGKRISSAIPYLLNDRVYPPELAPFEQQLIETAKCLPVVPTFDGDHRLPAQASLGPVGSGSFLPRRLFPTFAVCRDHEERALLSRLGVSAYEARQALQLLSTSTLTLHERAELIVGIAKTLPPELHDRKFLVDDRERPIAARNTCFPPPMGGRLPAPPEWAKRRFIHPVLWDHLMQRFAAGRREVIGKLSAFGVQEYNLEGLARALVQQAEQLIRRAPEREPAIRRDVLSMLQRLHARESVAPKFPAIKVKVLAQDGLWTPADELHLSLGYGLGGGINQALYGAHPAALIAPPDTQGLEIGAQEAAAFFQWIGVHESPRETTEASPKSSRADMMEALPGRFLVSDGSINQEIERSNISWGDTARFDAKLVAHLDSILATAPSEAILAWIARDARLDATARHFTPRFQARKNAAYFRDYKGSFPDLVKARIRQSSWLAGSDGEKHAPSQFLRDPGKLEGLFARPAQPIPELCAAFGIDQALWTKGLANAGVAATLQDVPETDIYRLLLDLPKRGLAPEVVKRFYLQILEREQFDVGAASDEVDRFFAEGRVQCRIAGRIEWIPVTEALYADRDGSLATARGRLALLDLPSRRNATNVTARFGVTALSRSPVTIRILSSVPASASIAAIVEHRFEGALPFISAYRSLVAPDSSALRKLEQLRLHVSTEVRTELSIGGETFASPLASWTHFLEGHDLHVVVDESLAPTHIAAMAAEAIGDGLSDLFEVHGGADIAKLLAAENDEMRKLLLVRMVPNFQPDEIDAILGEAVAEPTETVSFDLTLIATLENAPPTARAGSDKPAEAANIDDRLAASGGEAAGSASPQAEAQSQTLGPNGDVEESTRPDERGPSVPTTVVVAPIDSPEQDDTSKSKIDLRIHHGYGGGGGGGYRDPYRAGDAEGWAMRFEEGQGRFPLSVAHVQGTDGLGCDLLSFDSAEKRDGFLEDGELHRVARFIEVKSGGIHLTENETSSAKRQKHRYYVYQVIFENDARLEATLTLINDPLCYASALALDLRINIEDVANRESFRVTAASLPAENDMDEAAAPTAATITRVRPPVSA